ncbi:hypothetical protein ACIQVE_29130, partial [Pseudomonas sp. NPDC098747]|uniref:hypothetical protein n=1 Tax=Pseudomonas sp. NPDC098747 TaxID=3364487 RepID=UPI00383B4331
MIAGFRNRTRIKRSQPSAAPIGGFGELRATKKQPEGCFFLHRKLDLSQFFLDASCFARQVAQVV